MIRKSDITALIADDAVAASHQSMSGYRSALIRSIQAEAPPGVINNDSAASEIKWPMRSRERVWMAGMGEHGTIDLGHLWNKDTGEAAAIFIGPPDTPEAITLAFPCQSWAARVFNALVEEQGPLEQAEPPTAQHVLAPKHEGLRVDASGVLGRVEGPKKHFAIQMLAHLEEMATRYYGGDVAVVDEFLQLYCLDDKRPEVMTLPAACAVREEEPAEYVVGTQEQVEQEPVGEMRWQYRHPSSGEIYTVSLSRDEVQQSMDQEIFEKLVGAFCHCEPAGETNVVECRCDEYADEFELMVAAPPAAPDVSDLLDLLIRAKDCVAYQRDLQNTNHEAGRRHFAEFDRLVDRIDSVLSAHREITP